MFCFFFLIRLIDCVRRSFDSSTVSPIHCVVVRLQSQLSFIERQP